MIIFTYQAKVEIMLMQHAYGSVCLYNSENCPVTEEYI